MTCLPFAWYASRVYEHVTYRYIFRVFRLVSVLSKFIVLDLLSPLGWVECFSSLSSHRLQDDRGVQDYSLRWGLSIKYADIHALHVFDFMAL